MNSLALVVEMKGMDVCLEHGKEIEYYCEDHTELCCTTCAFKNGSVQVLMK
ncbi:hypothetical protein DPMN_039931 [Dreissena polymorpha]|uniref:B box-type domain-containing protein n=1 Tax=Dreissena polymorpha TaxID=45954 RepID=A0A9D4CUA2_DREPO|nr:hypothetical protein DPMN_039931 [Dreissena polymorpha]